jgi:hypothetical protein
VVLHGLAHDGGVGGGHQVEHGGVADGGVFRLTCTWGSQAGAGAGAGSGAGSGGGGGGSACSAPGVRQKQQERQRLVGCTML